MPRALLLLLLLYACDAFAAQDATHRRPRFHRQLAPPPARRQESRCALDWLVKRIEAQMKRMEFMPGYFEGKPVEMFYTEPVYD